MQHVSFNSSSNRILTNQDTIAPAQFDKPANSKAAKQHQHFAPPSEEKEPCSYSHQLDSTSISKYTHIAILGAGLIGRLLAYHLADTGKSIRIYERNACDDTNSSAFIAAAMLAPIAESAIADKLITELGLLSLQRWPQWITALNQKLTHTKNNPEEIFFQQQGTVVVWHPQDKEEAQRFAQRLDTSFTQTNYQPQILHNEQLAQLEPELAHRFSQALYLPSEGQLDNRALLTALQTVLEAKENITMHWHSPMQPDEIQADLVIDCRGMGAQTDWNRIASQQTVPAPQLRGVRGEVIRLYAPDVHLTRPIRLLHPRYPLYIAPKPNHTYVIGATEIESEDTSAVSVRSALELLSAAYTVHPGFGEARILEMRSQCRPTLAHHLPQIRWDGSKNIAINGLYRHGYLIAPAIIDATINLLRHIEKPTHTGYTEWEKQQQWPQLFYLSQTQNDRSIYQLHSHSSQSSHNPCSSPTA